VRASRGRQGERPGCLGDVGGGDGVTDHFIWDGNAEGKGANLLLCSAAEGMGRREPWMGLRSIEGSGGIGLLQLDLCTRTACTGQDVAASAETYRSTAGNQC
jgi:hypothetical protein